MITPTIADELRYVDRCVNPDYIIILQNKANEQMDFSQFKIMGLDEPVVPTKVRQFTAFCDPAVDEPDKLIIKVYEIHHNGCILNIKFKAEKKERWQEKMKRDYGIKEFAISPIINHNYEYESIGN